MTLVKLAGAAEHDANAVESVRAVLTVQSHAPMSDLVVNTSPLDGASASRATPGRHDGRTQRLMIVQHATAAAQNLRDRTQRLTEAVGQVALGTKTSALEATV